LSVVRPETNPQWSAFWAWFSDGILMVNALRAMILANEYVAFRRDTATQGGFEQQMPPQEAVMMLGLPALS
jgi:hypothetical protein